MQSGSAYRTFFERNHVAEVLGVEPGQVAERLGLRDLALSLQELNGGDSRARGTISQRTDDESTRRMRASSRLRLPLLNSWGTARARKLNSHD